MRSASKAQQPMPFPADTMMLPMMRGSPLVDLSSLLHRESWKTEDPKDSSKQKIDQGFSFPECRKNQGHFAFMKALNRMFV
jgi:hypothetical protein